MALHLRSGSNSDDLDVLHEINVTPFIDVILVLLIIFMVAAPLVMQPKIDISLPKSSTAKVEKDKVPLRVVLGKNGELFLNNKPISSDGLREEAKKLVMKNAETSALLIADKNATLEMVTDIVDAVKSGGVKKVAFSIQKK